MQSHFCVCLGQSGNVGAILDALVFVVEEGNQGALFGREPREGELQVFDAFVMFFLVGEVEGGIGVGSFRHAFVGRQELLPLFVFPQSAARHVVGDAVYPGDELAIAPVIFQRFEGFYKNILREVLGIFAVGDNLLHQREDALAISVEKVAIQLGLATQNALDVGLFLRIHRNGRAPKEKEPVLGLFGDISAFLILDADVGKRLHKNRKKFHTFTVTF